MADALCVDVDCALRRVLPNPLPSTVYISNAVLLRYPPSPRPLLLHYVPERLRYALTVLCP